MSPDIPQFRIVHDYMQVNGGAERLVLVLARELAHARLTVAGIYPAFSSTADVEGVQLEQLDCFFAWIARAPRALLAFSRPRVASLDAPFVFYSGIYAPLAVHRQRSGKRIYYCHTPPRFAFDRCQEYMQRVPALARPLVRLAIAAYRNRYIKAIRAMDVVLTNSKHVQQRLSEQIGVDAQVVYPPIDIERLRYTGQGNYYLSVARLEPNKRVDRIVRAFLSMPDKKLIVTSGGSQFEALKALAGNAPNIVFTNWVNDARLTELLGNATAVIYIPKDEDFGMSAVEAMACGKPVVGVNEGGLRESIVDGKTGILLPADPAPSDIVSAVTLLSADASVTMRRACESRAREFSRTRFVCAIKKILTEIEGA